MIVRIVKMTFQEDRIREVGHFLSRVQEKIKRTRGCLHLDILQDSTDQRIFFSYSLWRSEGDLSEYRNSAFFKQTWSTARKWFSDKPQAWSLTKLNEI